MKTNHKIQMIYSLAILTMFSLSTTKLSAQEKVNEKTDFSEDSIMKDNPTRVVNISPSADRNYIHTIVPKIEKTSIPSVRTPAVYRETVEYFDGLGRPLQMVAIDAAPDGKDIVTPIEYDIFGREAKKYLPYKADTNDGSYKTNALGASGAQQTFYNSFSVNGEKAWSEVYFEPSPLDRVLKEIGSGKDWHGTSDWKTNGKFVSHAYKTNVANEVRMWTSTDSQVSSSGNYSAGTLYATETTDEDGGKLIEYTDLQGRTVRQQQLISGSDYAITDFVYDDFGRLKYVLPPAIVKTASKTITVSISTSYSSTTEFAQFAYAYLYDSRGRVIEKHVPGAGCTCIIYNKLDQPILTQDADQRTRGEWSFTKHDAHGRIAVTGLYTNTSQTTRTAIQSLADGVSALWESRPSNSEWTSVSFPNSGTIYAVNYYDNYNFPNKESYSGSGVDARVQGLLTGTKVKVLDNTPYDLVTTIFYDSKSRVIHTVANQPKVENVAVKDETTNTYSFIGQLLTSSRKHTKGGTVMFTLTTTNTYDNAGRLMTVSHNIGTGNLTVADNTYNALGQLIQTGLHGGLETIDYAYNIRGWLKKISSENFREILHYQDVASIMGNTALWSGNISAVEWKAIAKDGYWHAYKYEYDKLSRLTAGVYTRSSGTSDVSITYGTNNGQYNENYTYDNMGNFLTLNRYHGNASTKIDELSYTYTNTGNQVNKIIDSGTSIGFTNGTANYTYTDAGRLKTDSQKGAMAYNHLGLLKTVTQNSETLTYTYDATGRRLKKQLGANTAKYYMDGVEYEGATLKFISTPYGRIRKENNDWAYDYFLKDHLGNVRVVLEAGSASGSSRGNTAVYLASMEEDRAAEENQYFENVDATRADRPYNYPDVNPTNAKLSKVPGKSEGLKISLKVMAGDTIEISANAFYNIDNTFPGTSLNVAPIIGAALAGMTNPINNMIGEPAQLASDLSTNVGSSMGLLQIPEENNQNNLLQPKSGINFVLYNSSMDVVDENTGYLPVDDKINAIQVLATDQLVMKESGFIEIFANNDAQTPVYYDNLMVTMRGGNVLEVNAYYHFGMIIPELSIASMPSGYNAYKFSVKELQTELGLNWHDFGNRMQDPVVGRFWAPDRYAEKYYHLSPYQFASNNPINYIDINGDSIFVDKTGYITRNDETDNLVYMSDNGTNTFLGELGGTINVDKIYTNLLVKSSSEAQSIWNPFTFRNKVKTNGDWDLKNDKKTIYGLGNDGKTNFSFQGNDMESQDIGNHHFGVVSKAFNMFSEETVLKQAGKYQIESGTSRPEWQIYTEENCAIISPTGGIINTKVKVLQPPYGDDPRDQKWIKSGFDYFKKR